MDVLHLWGSTCTEFYQRGSDWLTALLSVSLSADELSPELQKRGGGDREETTHDPGRLREGVVSDLLTEDERGGFHTWRDVMSSVSARQDCARAQIN